MKKSFIYILMVMSMVLVLSACSGYDTNSEGIITKPDTPDPTPTPQDTLLWDVVTGKSLPINKNMIATPWIKYEKNGKKDSLRMDSWLLDISTTDLVIYRENYQPSVKSGITPNADRSSEEEFKDKYGNMVTRHHYTQKYEFNNFTHQINGAWNTGYVLVKGKPENFWPEDGLYYNISVSGNTVNDTVHTVRNDSIFAIENVKLTYTATLKVDPSKPYTWYTYERTATVTVISFIGMVVKEPEIPTADWYVKNLTWHAAHGNRFPKGNDWEDGFLMSTDTHWVMLIGHYQIKGNKKSGKEEYISTEVVTIPKSEMATPVADRPYNAVMWDNGKYVPCCLSEDYNFNYGTVYADGTRVTLKPGDLSAVMDGVRNFTEDKTASPSPWLQTSCVPTQYKGKNYFSIVLKSSVHTLTATIADEALKK